MDGLIEHRVGQGTLFKSIMSKIDPVSIGPSFWSLGNRYREKKNPLSTILDIGIKKSDKK